MFRYYGDILSRIAEEPTWWQEEGVPRYGAFDPAESTGIYCNEVVLLEIACQHCDHRFFVTVERDATDRRLAKEIREGEMGWADPPNAGCCGWGPRDTSVPIRVVEYWARGHQEYIEVRAIAGREMAVIADPDAYSEWRRDASLEIVFPPEFPPEPLPG